MTDAKYFVRGCWIVVFITSIAVILLKNTGAPVHSVTVIAFNGLGIIACLAIFLYLVRHWYKTGFKSKLWKIIWLVALLFFYPYMVGPIAYYLTVFELGKTVRKE